MTKIIPASSLSHIRWDWQPISSETRQELSKYIDPAYLHGSLEMWFELDPLPINSADSIKNLRQLPGKDWIDSEHAKYLLLFSASPLTNQLQSFQTILPTKTAPLSLANMMSSIYQLPAKTSTMYNAYIDAVHSSMETEMCTFLDKWRLGDKSASDDRIQDLIHKHNAASTTSQDADEQTGLDEIHVVSAPPPNAFRIFYIPDLSHTCHLWDVCIDYQDGVIRQLKSTWADAIAFIQLYKSKRINRSYALEYEIGKNGQLLKNGRYHPIE